MHGRLKFDISWRSLLWAATGPPVPEATVAAARNRLTAAFGQGAVVVGLSVRTLFDAILGELALPAGTAVVMSGVNIANMSDIVRAHGLSIEAVDIDADRLSPAPAALRRAVTGSEARICVVAQLFGAVEDTIEPETRGGCLVIEDAAQAFAGDFYRGGGADVSLFSFGPIKRHTALGGAVAVFRDRALANRVQGRIDAYRPLSELWFRRRALKYVALTVLSTPWAYGAMARIAAWRGRDLDAVIGGVARGFSGGGLLAAIRRRLPKRMVALLSRQVARAGRVRERQRLCEAFIDGLPPSARVGSGVQRHAYWLMPVLARDPDAVVARLRAAGFDATRGQTSLRAFDAERTPAARRLIDQIVYLPHPAQMTDKARRRLQQAVIAALAASSASSS